MKKLSPFLKKALIGVVIFLLGVGAGVFYQNKKTGASQKEKRVCLRFLFEVYGIIKENYWEKLSEEELSNLFKVGIERLTAQPQSLKRKNKAGLEKLLAKILKRKSEEERKEFATKLADLVLSNLKPFGRSRLYTSGEKKRLGERIKNVSKVDQYKILGVKRGASEKEIERAYGEKIKRLEKEKESSPEVKKRYNEVKKAYRILSNPESRKIYDLIGAEPTVDYKLLRPEIFYLHIKKFSPTTLDELKGATEKVDKGEDLDTLILDLRDNVGGSIDLLPYFLGPFIGPNQYAYQFFHQGEKEDFKTKTGWLKSLVRYKKVVILINQHTQSAAELVAATLKKYNVGVLVGRRTKGWGTVEKVFSLKNQLGQEEEYSIFLVHSLTLREDGQSIEGNGVEPVVDVSHPGWERQLLAYFHYPKLIETVKKVWEAYP